MWAEAGRGDRDRKEIIVSFLSSKMTHTNEGLCHPDKAQEDGDSGQRLASIVRGGKE